MQPRMISEYSVLNKKSSVFFHITYLSTYIHDFSPDVTEITAAHRAKS